VRHYLRAQASYESIPGPAEATERAELPGNCNAARPFGECVSPSSNCNRPALPLRMPAGDSLPLPATIVRRRGRKLYLRFEDLDPETRLRLAWALTADAPLVEDRPVEPPAARRVAG